MIEVEGNTEVDASALTRMTGVKLGRVPIGVTVSLGVGVEVRVGVRVKVGVFVSVALGTGVSVAANPWILSRAEQACNKSIAIMLKMGLRMSNLIHEGLSHYNCLGSSPIDIIGTKL
jgi:hypothetical protein